MHGNGDHFDQSGRVLQGIDRRASPDLDLGRRTSTSTHASRTSRKLTRAVGESPDSVDILQSSS
eukprot:m.309472 g.309472  ORF g.309472 m.309472 type:complete len:64 (+) comp23118_c0_seq1:73-264(+)